MACNRVLTFLGKTMSGQGRTPGLDASLATILISTLVMRMKDIAFSDEREYRYITSSVGGGGGADDDIVWWRAGGRGPIPYAKLVDQDTQNTAGNYVGSLPLTEVVWDQVQQR